MTTRADPRIADGRAAKRLYLWIIGVLAVGAVLAIPLTVIVYRSQFGHFLSTDHSRWAQFGDYLGGFLGPIFAFLGFLALLITIYIQTRELQHSVEILGEQNESFRIQNFESAFFEMIRFHHDIVRDIDLEGGGDQRARGRDCFRKLFEKFRRECRTLKQTLKDPTTEPLATVAYRDFYRKNQHEIAHYFRNLHRILKFVDEAAMTNKDNYAGVLRDQLSLYESALLFYNGLSSVEPKLKSFIEQYAMLEYLDLELLIDESAEVRMYAVRAYGNQDVSRYFDSAADSGVG